MQLPMQFDRMNNLVPLKSAIESGMAWKQRQAAKKCLKAEANESKMH